MSEARRRGDGGSGNTRRALVGCVTDRAIDRSIARRFTPKSIGRSIGRSTELECFLSCVRSVDLSIGRAHARAGCGRSVVRQTIDCGACIGAFCLSTATKAC
jgi:hypothetical protein